MVWLVLFGLSALINWASVAFQWRRAEIISKPLTLFLLILFFWQQVGWEGTRFWFGLGLIFSLLGDTLLLDTKRYFLLGLAAFLSAHVFYIIGLNQDQIDIQVGSLIITVFMAGVGLFCHRIISKGLKRQPQAAGLRWAIVAYCGVITMMLVSAWLCLFRPMWTAPGNWMVAGGATLFVVSDFLLAYGMFVRPVRHGALWVMVAYHLGQVAITSGVMLRFLV